MVCAPVRVDVARGDELRVQNGRHDALLGDFERRVVGERDCVSDVRRIDERNGRHPDDAGGQLRREARVVLRVGQPGPVEIVVLPAQVQHPDKVERSRRVLDSCKIET